MKRPEFELVVEGMTCGHCAASVRKALEGVAGVDSARVSLEEAKAWVEGAPDPQALIEAVIEEGYRARFAGIASKDGDGKGGKS